MSAESFKAKSREVLGDYEQLTGERARKAFAIAMDMTEADKEWVRSWLTEAYNTQF